MTILDFLSDRTRTWSAQVWDGLIRAIDARFKPLEEQLDIQRATTDSIVKRGLTVIEDELAPIVAQGNLFLGDIEQVKADAIAAAGEVEDLSGLSGHLARTDNPHAVTAAQVGAMTAAEVSAAIAAAIDALLSGAPGALDTLNELAAALGNDANFAASVTTALAGKVASTRAINAGNGLTGGGDFSADRTLSVDAASIAQIFAKTANKVLTASVVGSGHAFQAIADGATITPDCNTFINGKVTLGGNRTLGAMSSTTEGRAGLLMVRQDATGGRTLAFSSAYVFANGIAPSITTTTNAINLFFYQHLDNGKTLLAPVLAVA